jgi:phosphoglycerate dehydrogenase-like enzyme
MKAANNGSMTRIVLHGEAGSAYSEGLADLLEAKAEIIVLPDNLTGVDRRDYAAAHVVVGVKFNETMPRPNALKLFHVPAAGHEGVDFHALPASAVVCNCFGHEQAIAEYVMTALLMRQVPILDADRLLRQADWAYRSGPVQTVHEEVAGTTIGLLGFGHIGKAIAVRAKAFEMKVHVANRSLVPTSSMVDRSFSLSELPNFCASADFIVVSLPLTPETKDIVDTEAFATMRSTAVVVNVGRGPTINERALFEALKCHRIAGAIIDTWYNYPSSTSPEVYPSILPFHELSNVLMTPHMSGWSYGTLRRRQSTIADNINRRMRGAACCNVVWHDQLQAAI